MSTFFGPRLRRSFLGLKAWAAEAGVSASTVRYRGERNIISRSWQDYRSRKPRRWVYEVWDLPDESGSEYLINMLERKISALREDLREAEERLDRVMLHRRARGNAGLCREVSLQRAKATDTETAGSGGEQ